MENLDKYRDELQSLIDEINIKCKNNKFYFNVYFSLNSAYLLISSKENPHLRLLNLNIKFYHEKIGFNFLENMFKDAILSLKNLAEDEVVFNLNTELNVKFENL
jgi:hypothetical protein